MKKIVIVTASTLLASLLFIGCSSKDEAKKEDLSKMQTETMQQMKDMSAMQKMETEKLKNEREAFEAEKAAFEEEKAAGMKTEEKEADTTK